MPRHEANKPSTRMGAVLDDFDELEALYDQAMEMIATQAEHVFRALPPKPVFGAVISERTRRQLTLGKVESSRVRMQRFRSGLRTEPAKVTRASIVGQLDEATQAAILEELNQEHASLDVDVPATEPPKLPDNG